MKYTSNRGVEKAFALPTVMIASIVMLMVLLSGLVAASSVNVSLREQVKSKQVSLTSDAGMAMADACMKANNFEITWSDASPLRPNTNCYGEDLSTCLVGTTSAPCYLTVAAANNSRSFFEVLANTGGDGSISSQATTQFTRPSNGTVASESKNTASGSVGYTLRTNVSAGGSGTCAISGERRVYCWGYNGYGQLGNGAVNSSVNSSPISVFIPGGTVQMQSVTRGFTHTCAVSMAGAVYCWGSNLNGQLGNGTTTGTSGSNNPWAAIVSAGQVPTGVKLNSVANGYYHSCAIGSDKKIYCWGDNSSGQLGIGTSTNTGNPFTPRVVSQGQMPAGVYPTSISSSYQHTCVTGSDVRVYCWGRNDEGQIGNGVANTTRVTVPTLVSTGAMTGVGATSVSVGYQHSCVTGTDGAAYCWGRNAEYQLGINNITPSYVPIKTLQGAVPANVKLTQIASYYQHTCALGSNSLLYCWGQNGYRQLGQTGTSTATATQPVYASAVTNAAGEEITGLSVGDYHTCVNSSNGKIYCWGYNTYGGLGSGTSTDPDSPRQVATSTAELGYSADTKIAVGSYHTCAIGPDEKVYCTGDDLTSNQLGNGGASTNTNTPTAVAQGAMPLGARIKNIWAGGYHTCALADNTKVYCWGRNDEGQLGNGGTGVTTVPVEVSQNFMPAGVKIRSMSLGMYYSCAVGSDFRAYCWGQNDQGQLGRSSTNFSSPSAVSQGAIPAGVNFRSVAAGASHTCAIATNAQMYCWGRNDEGQLGKGNSGAGTGTTTPVAVSQGTIPANSRMRQIATGINHTCAITSSSKAYCWGANNEGQIGKGDSGTTRVTTPTAVSQGNIPAGVGIRSITLGFYHSCAIASNGRPFCWGYNSAYQTGDGPQNVNKLTPTFVTDGTMPSGSKMKLMSTGMYSTCVLNEDGKIYCWGYNNAGGLGNGSSGNNAPSANGMVQSLRWSKNSVVDSTVLQY